MHILVVHDVLLCTGEDVSCSVPLWLVCLCLVLCGLSC